jgi:TPR repeat protein
MNMGMRIVALRRAWLCVACRILLWIAALDAAAGENLVAESFRKAAEQGDAEAQYNLGNAYHYGRGVAQDYAEAVKWWRKATEQGSATAQYSLGC